MIRKNDLNFGEISEQLSACIVVAVFENDTLSPSALSLDRHCDGYLSTLLRRNHLAPDIGSTLLLLDVPAIAASTVLFVRCGHQNGVSQDDFRKIIDCTAAELLRVQVEDALVYLMDVVVSDGEIPWKIRQLIERTNDHCYQLDNFKSAPSPALKIARLNIGLADPSQESCAREAIAQARAISQGKQIAKTLADSPANRCTPEYVASQAVALAASEEKITVDVLGREQMQALGMQALLAVGAAGAHEAKLVVINYRGSKADAQPVVMVGKGITFDSGGLSLKGSEAMEYMKYDMCGAAAVFGALSAVVELQLNINIIGILALAENMPDSNAIKPGDIVTTLSGQTVEVLNTDAEGRMVLCDALTYLARFNPSVVIDVATLTGASSIALGPDLTALFCNDEKLSGQLSQAADVSGDYLWRLPIHASYHKYLESKFADMANVGIKRGGSIIAACFLEKFIGEYPWAHLDIAGSACEEAKKNGATGRPVPLLTQYLIDLPSS